VGRGDGVRRRPGQAYLGTQGDVWDAQKDMALASLGALIAMAVTLVVNRSLGRDVAAEWAASFRVVHPEPLGEEEIARALAKRAVSVKHAPAVGLLVLLVALSYRAARSATTSSSTTTTSCSCGTTASS
jgi:putative membrane protein